MKDINLIPKSYFAGKKRRKNKVYLSILGILGVFIFLLAFIVPITKQISYESQLKAIISKAEESSGYVEKTKVLDEFHKIYENRETEATKILNFNNNELNLFQNVEISRPENLFIMSYKMAGELNDKRVLTLSCVSNTQEEIIGFIANLRGKKLFKDVVLKSLNKMAKSSEINNSNGTTNNNLTTKVKAAKTVTKIPVTKIDPKVSSNTKGQTPKSTVTNNNKSNNNLVDKFTSVIELYY